MDIHGGDNVNQQKGNSIDLPVNVKVYELYSKGLTAESSRQLVDLQ